MSAITIFLLAILWDLILGEPPALVHPTVWFGKLIGFFDRHYKRRSPALDFIGGAFASLFVIAFAFALSKLPEFLPKWFSFVLGVYLLKSSFAIKSLAEHVGNTIREDIEEQRKYVSWIVSRDVKRLDRAHLNSAAIESLAENITDSIVAPLFYYLLFGLSGALVYRAINTLDAMIGYKNERYFYFGKFAARMDDLLNFIPARITVFLFLPFNPKRVLEYYKRAKFKLNSDKPIAAMSAVLGVWLEKEGLYRFDGVEPTLDDIKRALRVYWILVGEWIAFVFASEIVKSFFVQ
ncbi:MAG: cobalamin biosynthesis protein [Palaeococcus sp.]|uniref:adenosylcobinamide-phosphate synthase CbiB n=1 Tax=Palaeococcus sp. (in: euryarchaeotes) TaxID=2820298 RepID=UPI0025F54F24|nr:adenosylcobinamide-phosphate synthase CbiB [Palaeococcus sp. (in: euryarchaeotes)]MCD6558775.1 cobalamin biosynthesis protein [Palaeococcus sp. (in: euryarchaeotes)]